MLFVHRSERADHLVEGLAELLADPPGDPLAGEIVSVPTRGVERWLTQRLSLRLGTGRGAVSTDGVCANVQFPFPGSLVGAATAAASGIDAELDPWTPSRSVWPLLEIVDAHLEEAFLAPLADHLAATAITKADGQRRSPRFPAVRRVADLFDRYAVHRPDLVRAWQAGRDQPDGGAPDNRWQAELWRRLRARIGVPGPAERFEESVIGLARHPDCVDLPSRLSVFGLTRLPATFLQVLGALAGARDVHLFLLHPSGALWDEVARTLGSTPASGTPRRAEDPTGDLASHPLLRSWGRDSREIQVVLSTHAVAGGDHRPVPENPSTLLGLVQRDIRADRAPAGPDAPLLAADDRTIAVHVCHGRVRQVEVLRDAIMHLLAEDPTLEPRDVIIMCPDIESFGPLIDATFAAGEQDAGSGPPLLPVLPVRLADRSLRQTNPLLAVTSHLLELADSRVIASEVLDLASREPVRRRFGFEDDDLTRIERWTVGSGIRWGLDGDHRAAWKLGGLEANTWEAGLDRVLLGVAMSEDGARTFGDVAPLDDVSSVAIDLAGRWSEFVERLAAALRAMGATHTVTDWAGCLRWATTSLAVAAAGHSWQHDQLERILEDVAAEARTASRGGADLGLDLSEVRSLLDDRLRGRPTRANFATGDLTACTLVPMRSVPHRVVCLLGLDDGVFPRHGRQDGDDLLLADPRIGDRDPGSEDRQLLLDAVLAATDHLVITYEGRDLRTNHVRPPSVPIAELLDVVDRTVRVGQPPGRARDRILVHHPLQAFDPRNFEPGGIRPEGPWGFDPVELEGARRHLGPERPERPFLAEPLAPLDRPVVSLDDLCRFFEHPVRAFLRQRLGVYEALTRTDLRDDLPVAVDGLDRWTVGDRLLAARLGGTEAAPALSAERRRGLLPPGPLGGIELDAIADAVEALVVAAGPAEGTPGTADTPGGPVSLDVNLALADGRSLVGTVPGVRGGFVLRCLYSRLSPGHRMTGWIRFLAATAADPGSDITAVTIGRGERRHDGTPTVLRAELPPLGGDGERRRADALAALAVLVDVFDRGMCEPIPLYCRTSAGWAAALGDGDRRSADRAAEDCWRTTTVELPGEDKDPEHVRVLGPDVTFDQLLQARPAAGESGTGWPQDEESRFARYARRVWEPVLQHERLTQR